MALNRTSRVAAVIPYYGVRPEAERWLGECLESLLRQTIPLVAIAVVDDASPRPPDALMREFPTVCWLRNSQNTGPFAILDAVFERASCDALLLNDSDDWSKPNRLAVLLDEAERFGAELVGCQAESVFEDVLPEPVLAGRRLPADPRTALMQQPRAHPILLPASVVACDLGRRLGGLASGLRFGADSEFVRRAAFGAIVRNAAEVCYVRRVHSRSLTRHPETGMGSAQRMALQRRLQQHAEQLVRDVQLGRMPDLRPLEHRRPIRLEHVSGSHPHFAL